MNILKLITLLSLVPSSLSSITLIDKTSFEIDATFNKWGTSLYSERLDDNEVMHRNTGGVPFNVVAYIVGKDGLRSTYPESHFYVSESFNAIHNHIIIVFGGVHHPLVFYSCRNERYYPDSAEKGARREEWRDYVLGTDICGKSEKYVDMDGGKYQTDEYWQKKREIEERENKRKKACYDVYNGKINLLEKDLILISRKNNEMSSSIKNIDELIVKRREKTSKLQEIKENYEKYLVIINFVDTVGIGSSILGASVTLIDTVSSLPCKVKLLLDSIAISGNFVSFCSSVIAQKVIDFTIYSEFIKEISHDKEVREKCLKHFQKDEEYWEAIKKTASILKGVYDFQTLKLDIIEKIGWIEMSKKVSATMASLNMPMDIWDIVDNLTSSSESLEAMSNCINELQDELNKKANIKIKKEEAKRELELCLRN